MADWEYSSSTWLQRQEQLAPNRWLVCFTRPEGISNHTPAHWIYVFKERFNAGGVSGTNVFFHCIEQPDPLMMECIAHEMRKKYSNTP